MHAVQHICCLSQVRINLGRVAAGRAFGVQLGDDGGGGIDGSDRVASSRIVGALAYVNFPTPLKMQNDVFWYRPNQVVTDKWL